MGRIKKFLKKIYYKLNPQHKQILLIRDVVLDIQRKVSALEEGPAQQVMNASGDTRCLDKLFLASEPMVYRYLYLLRYIKEGDTVLDIEGGYGTGDDLLSRYTPVEGCLCLNSIDYYTRVGEMYYGSDYVKFRTGTAEELDSKFCIILSFDENRTGLFTERDFQNLCRLLEYGGILALAVDAARKGSMAFLEEPEKYGLKTEAVFYQNEGGAELTDYPRETAIWVGYFRKND